MTQPKKRILVVDDDLILRQLAEDILSDEYEVMLAVDGQDAWEKTQGFRPDLVITDLMMPRMHGYELCERLRGPDGIKGVRILVASAKSFATDKAQAKLAGADAYLVKPYKPAELKAQVRALLSGAQSSAAPAAAHSGIEASPAPEPRPASGPSGRPAMYVRFWGTRGSCPVSGPNTLRHGGNTSCIEVRIGDLVLILDCGTGVRELGKLLTQEFKDRPLEGHIFVGHTHWDHIQGFPFFTPLYNPRNTFNIYSVRAAHGSLQTVFGGSMASDYFPIPLTQMAGKLRFVEMAGPVDLGAARVSFCHLNHPGLCIGFRIEAQGRVVTYLGDRESYVKINGDSELSRRQDADLVAFAKGSDLLIAEAQYTEEEYPGRKGWGHSTFDDTVRCAMDAEAKRLAFFHHDPDHTDEMMDAYVDHCRAIALRVGGGTECMAAQDGMRIDL
jgi:CheY-like chemotaxis protein/phosphoribosyl 1,2-cyclic phosphodiesterase